MTVPEKKRTDLIWLSQNLPTYYSKHTHFEEALNLVNKLMIIKK